MKTFLRSIFAASATVFTLSSFAAAPAAPSGVKAENTPEGVVIVWEPVTEDVDENAIPSDEVIYDVYRCDASDTKTLVSSDLTATTCTDILGEITGEVFYRWQVIAKTADGTSSQFEGYSETLSFGDGAALPYTETFNTPESWYLKPDNYWLSESTLGYSEFDVDDELYVSYNDDDFYVHGADYTDGNDDGFLYFEPSKWSDNDVSYTSGNINLGSAEHPVISFFYYAFPDAHNLYQVSILDGEGKAHEIVNTTPTGDATGWKKTDNVALDAFKGQKIRIKLHASYFPDAAPATGVRVPICLDNIKVEEGMPAGIDAVTTAPVVETSYYSIDGRRLMNPGTGRLVIKVERCADGSTNTLKVIMR